MNVEVKAKWIEALTSGKYEQICFYMSELSEIEDGPDSPKGESKHMCATGVLADLALKDSGLKYSITNWKKFAAENNSPTDKTLKWAGLTNQEVADITDLNDGHRKTVSPKTFVEIAQYIQENF